MKKSNTRRGISAGLAYNISGWVIMLPTLILFAFFVWEPLLESVRLSFYTAQGVRLKEFVGFQNYKLVFHDANFFPAFKNTFIYMFWSLIIGYLMPIVMAVLITETAHARSFFRTAVYFPNIVPGMATVMLWYFFFSSGNNGVINILLGKLGLGPYTLISNPMLTIPIIVLTMTWKSAAALIYMAGIGSINPELYEAATIDGAKLWSRFWHITVPNIFGLAKTLLILQLIAVFQILYEPLVMTNGGPGNASISLMLMVYNYAFKDFNYPKAAALSVLISIILVLLTVVYFALTKSKDDRRKNKIRAR